jgi:hypothetical protein
MRIALRKELQHGQKQEATVVVVWLKPLQSF